MATSRTLAQIRTALTVRGGYENSTDMTASVLLDFINEAIAETYDLVVSKCEEYYVTSTTFVTVAGTDTYNLPADHYHLRKLEVQSDATRWLRILPVDLTAAHRYTTPVGKRYRYRIQGQSIVFAPPPAGVDTIRIYYIPQPTILAADGDTYSFQTMVEMELVLELAYLRCKRREELETSDIEREVERLSARLRTGLDGRDAEPFYLSPDGPPADAWDDEEGWGY